MNWMNLVPPDVVESMIHGHIDEGIEALVTWAHQAAAVQPGETPALLLFERDVNGTPSVFAMVQVLDAQLNVVRRPGLLDLRNTIKRLPIARIIREFKKRAALLEKLESRLERATNRAEARPEDVGRYMELREAREALDAELAKPSPLKAALHTTETKQLPAHGN